jgi:hypothetical protein
MDITQLYMDFSVEIAPTGHKHCIDGWINVYCPYCSNEPGHDGYHLGFNLHGEYFHCWRCGGGKPIPKTLSLLLHITEREVYPLIKQYGLQISSVQSTIKKVGTKDFKFPSDTQSLSEAHKRYLQSRKFDPDHLVHLWELKSTGPISKLDKSEYNNRILFPYYWNGQVVSFDTRVPRKMASHDRRYKACPKEFEVIDRKCILYGKQSEWSSTGILVEGPSDVWRLGVKSCGVSGIEYTPEQVRIIAKSFKRVFILFDPEKQAQKQAKKLRSELLFRQVDAIIYNELSCDPGDLSQDDADYLVKHLIR